MKRLCEVRFLMMLAFLAKEEIFAGLIRSDTVNFGL